MLLMVSGKWIWSILLRQLLIRMSTFLIVVLVVLHVCAPYGSTDVTLELSRRIFVWNDNTLEFQMFLSCINAPPALPVLVLTSAPVSPCLSMILPRYVKVSTSSKSFPSSVTVSVLATLTVLSCLHNPVDNQNEEERGHQATLSNSGLYFETVD